MPQFDSPIPLQDFAPDSDSIQEGIILDMDGFYPETSGYRTLPGFTTLGGLLPRQVLGGYIGQLVSSSSIAILTVAAVNNILYSLNGNTWTPQISGLNNVSNRWRFAVYGQDMIAVDGVDAVYYFRLSPSPVVNETYGTGNGTVGPYTHTAASIPIVPGTISITGINNITVGAVTDDGKGNLLSPSQSIIGSVNYTTGAMSVTSPIAIGSGQAILVSYTPSAGWQILAGTNTPVTNEAYGTGDGTMGAFTHTLAEIPVVPGTVVVTGQGTPITNETYGTGNGTVGPYAHTAASAPIVPGTIVISVANQSARGAYDDGLGNLYSLANVKSGTVNYMTGAMTFTLGAVINSGNRIAVAYTPSQVATDTGVGTFGGGGTGTINYQTGAVSVTFTSNVPNSVPITVNYTPVGTPPATSSIVTVTDYAVILIQANSQILFSNLSDTASWQPSVPAQVYKFVMNATEGNITACWPLRSGLAVYKAGAIQIGTFVGGFLGWNFQTISKQVGVSGAGTPDGAGQEAVVNTGDFHYLVGPDDFWQFDGYNLQPIPNNVKEFFFRDLDQANAGYIAGRYDRVRDLIVWHYPSKNAEPAGSLDSYIGFYKRKGNWFFGRLNIDLPMGGDLSSANAGVGLFLPNHQLNNYDDSAVFSPISGNVFVTTWDVGDRRWLYQVNRVRPGFQLYPVLPAGSQGSAPAPAKLTPLSQYLPGYPGVSPDPQFIQGPTAPISADGWFNLVNTGRTQRFKIQVYGACQLNNLEIVGKQAGEV